MLLAMRMEEACNYMYVIGQFNFKIDVSQFLKRYAKANTVGYIIIIIIIISIINIIIIII